MPVMGDGVMGDGVALCLSDPGHRVNPATLVHSNDVFFGVASHHMAFVSGILYPTNW